MGKKKHYMIVSVEVEVQNFINDIYLNHDNDVLFALVAGLDEACDDWDFTEKCRDYFVAAMEAKDMEEAEEAGLQEAGADEVRRATGG